ncbi:Cytochrome P450 2B6 [Manis pentadactyla]|nr:Cytochrome P450 2B6 [Manis pentadactyla]
MALRVAPGQEKQESQESKEEEDTELHDPRPAAFHPTAALSWAFYLETTSATSYVTSAVPCHPFIIVQECELERSPRRPTLPSQEEADPHTEFNQENLLISTLNIFFAKIETTSTTLRYGLLILLKHPPVTELKQQGIDQAEQWGQSLEAIHRYCSPGDPEVHRHHAPGVPHTVTQDTPFRGHLRDTGLHRVCAASLYPDQFQDPTSFQPKRFLDAKGVFWNSPAFLPFSASMWHGEGARKAEDEVGHVTEPGMA